MTDPTERPTKLTEPPPPPQVSVLPFGGHFVKSCLTSLEVYLVNDPRLHMNETRYGLLLSMTSLPNFFIPFLGGVFLDKRGHRFATLLFLFLVLIGQVIFTIAIQLGDFQLGARPRQFFLVCVLPSV